VVERLLELRARFFFHLRAPNLAGAAEVPALPVELQDARPADVRERFLMGDARARQRDIEHDDHGAPNRAADALHGDDAAICASLVGVVKGVGHGLPGTLMQL
jgi:hypothetical protein